jgi:ketosteroid isomerase-like protein
VRSIYADWERGDFSQGEWADPDIEWVLVEGPSPDSWKGRAETTEGFRDWTSAWEEFCVEADEYRELDDERVLVLTRARARGKTSGLELAQISSRGAQLFHLRGGKVTRLVVYFDSQRALSDLGLEA